MLSTKQIMEMTGLSKWSVIRSLLDGRFIRTEESVQAWIDSGAKIKSHVKRNLPFNDLDVGEYFSTSVDIGYVRNRASQIGKKLNRKFSVSKTESGAVVERTE